MRLFLLSTVLLGLTGTLPAAKTLDFSGTWKMNAAASDFGNLPAPTSLVRVIRHQEPNIKVQTTQVGARGEIKTEFAYTTDGRPFRQSGASGEVKGNAKWNGNTLIVISTRTIQDAEISQEDRWSLSPDGKVLKVDSRITSPRGIVHMTVSFDKQ